LAIGDGHSGEGATLYEWDPDVLLVVQRTLNRFSTATGNTYECHPYCGWERRSLDVWGAGGRGDPLPRDLSRSVLRFLLNMPGEPLIRHYILEHTLWVRGKGYFNWPANDHSGRLRHVHVTYLPVPPIR
jgi:hypothetical protein